MAIETKTQIQASEPPVSRELTTNDDCKVWITCWQVFWIKVEFGPGPALA